jgi:hypothetical protein
LRRQLARALFTFSGVSSMASSGRRRRYPARKFRSMSCPRQQTLAHGLGDGLGHIARS